MRIFYNPELKEKARQLRNNPTWSEKRLWKFLKGNQCHGYIFHRQKPIDRYIVDFFCFKLKLAIECDGFSHELVDAYEKDMRKTTRLNQLGIHVLRFKDEEVFENLEEVLSEIEEYITRFESEGYTPP